MATTTIQDYELMLIYTPVLTEEEFRNAQNKVQEFITKNNGEIVHKNPWGLRSLAYPIQKKTTGLYYVLEYKAPTDVNSRLVIEMNRDENILRHLITHLDKHAVAYNASRRNGVAKKASAPKAEAKKDDDDDLDDSIDE